MSDSQEDFEKALGELLKEYRRIRIAFYYGLAKDTEPPSWEAGKKLLMLFGDDEEKLEFQKWMF